MKLSLLILTILLTASFSLLKAQNNQVSYTLDDRDRMIRLEIKVEEMDKRFENQINDLKSFLYWGFGILFGMMWVLFGFIIWDRRTAITPVSRRTKRLEEAMIEFSKNNADFREILKKASIL